MRTSLYNYLAISVVVVFSLSLALMAVTQIIPPTIKSQHQLREGNITVVDTTGHPSPHMYDAGTMNDD
jgi:hypothetical protein